MVNKPKSSTEREEKDGFLDKVKQVQQKLYFDSHHTIERFGVIVSVATIAFVGTLGGLGYSSYVNSQINLDKAVIYTPTITTTKTQSDGVVDGLYVSKDKRRALTLFHFEDAETFTTDIDSYQAYITGLSSGLDLEYVKTPGLVGHLVSFGNGYFGMVLDAAQPFEKQLLKMTFRANKNLQYVSKDDVDQDMIDDGSTKYDQWTITINPKGSSAIALDSLNTSSKSQELDLAQLYYDTLIKKQEDDIRKKLNDDLGEMQAALVRIDDATLKLASTKNLDGLKVRIPEMPKDIADDEVFEDEAGDLKLSSNTVVRDGYDFNWRDGDIKSGYLKMVTADGESITDFIERRNLEGETTGSGSLPETQWLLSDGSKLSDHNADNTLAPLIKASGDLETAWNNYYQLKVKYEAEDLPELLMLEIDWRNAGANAKMSTNPNAVVVY